MELVQQALDALLERADVAGAALVSGEGLVVASRLPAGLDAEAVAALANAALREATQLSQATARGSLARLILDSADGLVLACALPDGAALVVLAQPGAAAGKLLFDLRQQSESLAALLHPHAPG